MINKQLQSTHFPIPDKVETNSQINFVSWWNVTRVIFSFRNHAENEAERLVPKVFKNLISGKNKRSAALFQYNLIALNLGYKKNKPSKTLYYASRDMLNFAFLEKCLGRVSPLHFFVWFIKKIVPHVIFY